MAAAGAVAGVGMRRLCRRRSKSALRAHEKTRNAVMQVEIRLWADASGRVSRVQLVSSTGDSALDAVIRNEVFGGLVLREPPPKDMPMPMVTRVTARHPS